MAHRLVNLQREDVKPRTIFDRLGVDVDAYICFTGEETFIICDKKSKGDYRVYSYRGKDDVESFFDEDGKCNLLPEYTLLITDHKETAVLGFVEVAIKGYTVAEALEPKPNPLHFGITLCTWVQEEIRKNKRPDETDNDFVERAILEHCRKRKHEVS